jgi:hypothetical protein
MRAMRPALGTRRGKKLRVRVESILLTATLDGSVAGTPRRPFKFRDPVRPLILSVMLPWRLIRLVLRAAAPSVLIFVPASESKSASCIPPLS